MYVLCPSCHGKGGTYILTPKGVRHWVKCTYCHPKQTTAQARADAINRYVNGKRTDSAKDHALGLGATPEELHTAVQTADDTYRSFLNDYR